MNVARYLVDVAAKLPDQLAVIEGGRTTTYAEFSRRVAKVAGALRAVGVEPGDRVALLLPNRAEFLESLFGALAAGAVVVPIGTRLHPKEWEYILRHSESRVLVHAASFGDEVAAECGGSFGTALSVGDSFADSFEPALATADAVEPVVREPSDLAWLFYTSGTTGHPKGAMVTHGNLVFMTECYLDEVYDAGPSDRALHAGPLTHGSGLWAISLTAAGATHVLPTTTSFDPADLFDLIERHRVTKIVFLSPTMVKMLIEAPEAESADCSSLQFVGYGGAPMHPADLRTAMERWGDVLANIYGQGECPMTISMLSPADHARAVRENPARLRSAGRPRSGISVSICDEDGRDLSEGEIGEICVSGPIVMSGYWRNDAATAEVFRTGEYRTGDLGRFDDDGYLYLLDRTKELVISGGSNIYPREVENVLLQHNDVREVAVFGVPDRFWGESVVALIVPKEGKQPRDEELIALCRQNLASYKKPRWIFHVDSLPRNATGKVLKRELSARYAALVGEVAQ